MYVSMRVIIDLMEAPFFAKKSQGERRNLKRQQEANKAQSNVPVVNIYILHTYIYIYYKICA